MTAVTLALLSASCFLVGWWVWAWTFLASGLTVLPSYVERRLSSPAVVTLFDIIAVSHFLAFLLPVAAMEFVPPLADPGGLYSLRLETIQTFSLAYLALTIGALIAFKTRRRIRVSGLGVDLAEVKTLRLLVFVCFVWGLLFKASIVSAGIYWRDTYQLGAVQYVGAMAPLRDFSAVGLLLAGYGAARGMLARRIMVGSFIRVQISCLTAFCTLKTLGITRL